MGATMETKDVGGSRSGVTADEQVALLMGPIAESGNVSDFESLMKKNPCVLEDMAVRTANTPLHVAARLGHLELVKAIMDRRPRWAQELNQHGSSPVHQAAESGHVEVVTLLLERSTNPELYRLRDCHGRTPLHCAAASGKHGVVEALSEFPDYLNEVTVRGETALQLAAKNKHKRVLEILMGRLDQEPEVGTRAGGDEATMPRNRGRLMDRLGITIFQLAHSNTIYNQLTRSLMYNAEGMILQLIRSLMYCAEGMYNGRWYTLLGLLVAVYLDEQHMVGVMRQPIAQLFLFMFFLRHMVRLLRPSIALVFFLMVFLAAIFKRRKRRSINYDLPRRPLLRTRVTSDMNLSAPPATRVTNDLDLDLALALGWVIIPPPSAPVTNDPASSLPRTATTPGIEKDSY